MAASAHKFTAVTTALLVLVAHALCVCRTAAAARAVPADAGERAAHACCNQPSQPDPKPAPDHPSHHSDGHCSHCDGPAVVVAPAGPDTGPALSPAYQLDTVWATGADEFATLRSAAVTAQFVEPAFVSTPTLLRLRCALNL
jgi:hypothetical protein